MNDDVDPKEPPFADWDYSELSIPAMDVDYKAEKHPFDDLEFYDPESDPMPIPIRFNKTEFYIPGDLPLRGGELVREKHSLDEESKKMLEVMSGEVNFKDEDVVLRQAVKVFYWIWSNRNESFLEGFPRPTDLPE